MIALTESKTRMPDRCACRRRYNKALLARDVALILGQSKDRFLTCRKRGRIDDTKEEKETDVNIALEIVGDGYEDAYDRAIVLSANTDLGPAIDRARARFPKKEISVFAPPCRRSRARGLKPAYELKPGRVYKCLLPEIVEDRSAGKPPN